MAGRPASRKKNTGGSGGGVHRRGSGLGSGPVGGRGSGSFGTGSSSSRKGSSRKSGPENRTRGGGGSGGCSSILAVLVLIVALLGGGGGIIGNLLSGSSGSSSYTYGSGSISGWNGNANTGTLNREVSGSAREKRTRILGDGKDQVTIMVYMCGTDLESRSAMATKDLQEMLDATLSDKVNLLVYTGGCSSWRNNKISSTKNQVWQIKNGSMVLLKEEKAVAMVKPSTLSSFIQYAAKQAPANRYELILWDHGGGSLTGYGYDEKYKSAGSMNLSGINTALKDGGVTFDFVGFDACLMATVETSLVVSQYADYLIASEETEPGVGWYYTDWLNAFAENTSADTLDIGKEIVDTYTSTCASSCKGQSTTLSLIDLAEISETVPSVLSEFSKSASDMIENKEFKTISEARSGTREFAASSKIDQVDLVDLAKNMGTKEGTALSDALLSAVKYNMTSSDMVNSFGVSAYFPYKNLSRVDSMVQVYDSIGMDEEYSRCIQQFASMEVSGQVAGGGTHSAAESIFGSSSGTSSVSSSSSQEVIAQLLTQFMNSDFSSISGLNADNTGFLGKTLDIDMASEYIAENQFDGSALRWTKNEDGKQVITISEEQWELVQDLDLNLFYDDGEGYIDLGYDNVFDYDDAGSLLAPQDRTWLALNGQIVAYYRLSTIGEGDDQIITGWVPAMLNGNRVRIYIIFDPDNPDGYVAGASYNYSNDGIGTQPKNLTELTKGDTIDFLCDFYDYNGTYQDSYYLGEQMTLDTDMNDITVTNENVGDGTLKAMFRFTDVYGETYWTPAIDE